MLPAIGVGFVFTGLATAILGPLLPALSAAWRFDDAAAGALFTARSFGCLVGVAAVGVLTRRTGLLRVLVVGFGLTAVGSAFTPADSWVAGVAAIFLTGVGLTVATAGANLYVAETQAHRRAEALNVLNFVWGAGATAAPAFVEAFGGDRAGPPMYALAGMFAVVTVWAARGEDKTSTERGTQDAAPGHRSGSVWLVGVVIFFYVGSEMAVGGWVGTYALRMPDAPETAGMMATSAFWGALLVGRLLAPVVLRWIRGEALVLLCTAASIGGAAATALAGSWETAAAGAGLAGLSLAAIFPTAFATFARIAGAGAAHASWVIFAMANVGGAIVPWLVGVVSDATGDLRTGLFVPVATCALMLAAQSAVLVADRR